MVNKQIRRIQKMEERLDRSRDVIGKLAAALEEYEAAQDEYYELENYYSSRLWMADYEDDEAGKIPADLKRGVLSEDAVYDLITEHRDLMTRMQRCVLKSMENEQK
jgi:hypothetical protein